jgi:hypothetical protein
MLSDYPDIGWNVCQSSYRDDPPAAFGREKDWITGNSMVHRDTTL